MTTWIEQATARFGEPYIALPEPVIRFELNRRCWVWSVDGQNFNVAIDQLGTGFQISANAPGRHIKIWTDAEPTDGEIRLALDCAWPGFRAEQQRRPRRKTIELTDEMVNAVVLADSARAGLSRALELAGFTVTDDEVTTC